MRGEDVRQGALFRYVSLEDPIPKTIRCAECGCWRMAFAEWQDLLSDEHFSIDGSVIDVWASHKSFVPKDSNGPFRPTGRNPEVDFSGKKRRNAARPSTTDPGIGLCKKGKFNETKRHYLTQAKTENRHSLIANVETAAVEADEARVARTVPEGSTVAADKGYDQERLVKVLLDRGTKPHVARRSTGSAVEGRTAEGQGFGVILRHRRMVEEAFGRLETVGSLRKTRYKGLEKVAGLALLCFAAYNFTWQLSLLGITLVAARAVPA